MTMFSKFIAKVIGPKQGGGSTRRARDNFPRATEQHSMRSSGT